MCGDNVKTFIATLYNVLIAPDLCHWSFSIIVLTNSVHKCLFHKWFCAVLFSDNANNEVILLHRAQLKHALLLKTKKKVKITKEQS